MPTFSKGPASLMAACIYAVAFAGSGSVFAGEARNVNCIVPAKPGGGFDLSCGLVKEVLEEDSAETSVLVSYLPGSIGASAYNEVVARRSGEGNTIVAFSSGSLLNIAQGKFGRHDHNAVRWLAGIAIDYGIVAVRADSPYQNLADLINAMHEEPKKVVVGVGGAVGSQDWMKLALLAKNARVNPLEATYVSFEGGGETLTALMGGYVSAACGELSEVAKYLPSGNIRILAVFSPRRLDAKMSSIPTAKEQGFDIVWPVIRGFYMGPKVSGREYAEWTARMDDMLASSDFAKARRDHNLSPFALTGARLEEFVDQQVSDYERISRDAGLIR